MNQTLRYTAKEILWTIPILVGTTFLVFDLGLVARGDPATNRTNVDPNYTPTEGEIQELRAEMGLDDPILMQYGHWVWNAAHGDPEESYIGDKSVLGGILRLLPNTLLLSGMALLVITVVGLVSGLLLTLSRDELTDLLGRILPVFLMSIPGLCLAYSVIWLFTRKLCILPTSGAETLSCFLMPCLTVSVGSACMVIRLLCSSILGELSKNYILTAQAKSLRRGRLISRHALRNPLAPSITYIANTFGGLLGGSVITGSVFSVPGIGSYVLTAINNRDYIAIQGYTLFTSVAFALVCLLAGLVCVWLDPQIRLGG